MAQVEGLDHTNLAATGKWKYIQLFSSGIFQESNGRLLTKEGRESQHIPDHLPY